MKISTSTQIISAILIAGAFCTSPVFAQNTTTPTQGSLPPRMQMGYYLAQQAFLKCLGPNRDDESILNCRLKNPRVDQAYKRCLALKEKRTKNEQVLHCKKTVLLLSDV